MTEPFLKEQIKTICLPESSWSAEPCDCEACKSVSLKRTEKILSLIRDRIEKIENPYQGAYYSTIKYEAFEACREKALKELK